jgi:hypothetical protein
MLAVVAALSDRVLHTVSDKLASLALPELQEWSAAQSMQSA